jgi:hypothetical protein
MAVKAAEREREEAIRLAYCPKDILKDKLVSKDEYKPGENSSIRGDGDDDISIFG